MIKQYVHAITRHLPFKNRKEVEKELISNIYEAIGDNPSEEETLNFLKKMGHPRDVAAQYMDTQYLIGPNYFAKYLELLILVAKIVLPIIFVLTLLSSLLNPLFDKPMINVILALSSAAVSTISGAIIMFAITTIIFAFIERRDKEIELLPFNFETLKKTNIKNKQNEIVFSGIFMLIGSVFLLVLILTPDIVGIYENFELLIPLFNHKTLQTLIPMIIVVLFASFTLGIMQLMYREENKKVLILDSIVKSLSILLFIVIIKTPNIINRDFINYLKSTHEIFSIIASNMIYFIYFLVLIDLGNIIHNMFKIKSTD